MIGPQFVLFCTSVSLFAGSMPLPSVYKSEIWYVGSICMCVDAIKDDFFLNFKIGRFLKNLPKAFMPDCSNPVR